MSEKNIKTDYIKKTEEEKVNVWKIRLSAAKQYMEENFKSNAERYCKFFKGEHWGRLSKLGPSKDLIVINYVYSIIKSIIPQTYYQDPYFNVTATHPKWQQAEQLIENVINYKWRELRIKQTIRRIHLDQLIMGFGAGKLGYSFVTEKDYSKPNLDMGLDYTELVKEDNAFFLRVSPFDIVFDIEAKHFSEMKWLATRFYVDYEEAKERFKGYDASNVDLPMNSNLEKIFSSNLRNSYKDKFKKVEIWEIQDLENDYFYYVTDGYDKFISKNKNLYGIGFNTKLFWVNDCPDQLYPLSDVAQIEDLNLELDKTRTQMLNHRRKIQRKILCETSAFKNREELNKFLNDEDMQLVEVKDGALTSQKIMIVQPGILPPEFYNIDRINKDDIYQVAGAGANMLASEGLVQKSATEASIIERNANIRNAERIDMMNDYCETVARGLLAILQKFDTKENSFYSQDKEAWIVYTNEDIAGDYTIEVKIGSMQRPNEGMQTEILMNVLPKFLDMIDSNGTPLLNAQEIFKNIMKKSGFADSEIKKMINTLPTSSPNETEMSKNELLEVASNMVNPTQGLPYPQVAQGVTQEEMPYADNLQGNNLNEELISRLILENQGGY